MWLLLDLLTVIPEEFSTQVKKNLCAKSFHKFRVLAENLTEDKYRIGVVYVHLPEWKENFPLGDAKSKEIPSSSGIDAKSASRDASDAARTRAKGQHAVRWRRCCSGTLLISFCQASINP